MQSLLNFRRKGMKFKKDKEVMIIGKKGSEGLLMRFKDITGVQWKLAKDHMDQRVH